MNRDVQLECSFKYLHEKLCFNFYHMLAKFDASSSYTNFSSEQIDFFVEGKQEQKQFSLLIFHKIRFWGKKMQICFLVNMYLSSTTRFTNTKMLAKHLLSKCFLLKVAA